MSTNLKDAKAELAAASDAYHSTAQTSPAADAANAADRVVAARAAVSAAIADGAKPCPYCNQPPHGIEHQTQARHGIDYEVGCLGCKPVAHDDGTERRVAARGGPLPRHAVEAWNEGPEFWLKARPKPAPKDA